MIAQCYGGRFYNGASSPRATRSMRASDGAIRIGNFLSCSALAVVLDLRLPGNAGAGCLPGDQDDGSGGAGGLS